jgi:hypothetical protein
MKSNNPRIERLKEMMSLEERRGQLQAELDELTGRMNELRIVFSKSRLRFNLPLLHRAEQRCKQQPQHEQTNTKTAKAQRATLANAPLAARSAIRS